MHAQNQFGTQTPKNAGVNLSFRGPSAGRLSIRPQVSRLPHMWMKGIGLVVFNHIAGIQLTM
jgi:hypothetical protein